MYPHSEDEDAGCLRWVMGVPLVMLHVIAAAFLCVALAVQPGGPWDHDAYTGIAMACLTTVLTNALALAITVLPPTVRRAMGPWWLAPPLVMGAVALVRWALVSRGGGGWF
ncbi:hypothetical protein [Streptomyces sp. SKN60]|uniref:hypothetical protein n=1 Tax=Streptomyces sp. SKN60 TaxID=2855506 RepID=UPI0022468122|nr:hypothetical protein [Streptomyces sp. SKN60]